MNYLTAYDWQQSDKGNVCSLILEQVRFQKGHTVVFACICEEERNPLVKGQHSPATGWNIPGTTGTAGAGAYLTECLRSWFFDSALPLSTRPGEGKLHALGRSLRRSLCRAERELGREDTLIGGVFCLNNLFFVFSKRQQLMLINTRFGRPNCNILPSESSLFLQYGRLQNKTGILLMSQSFLEHMDMPLLKGCLMVEEMNEKEQLQRHLRELCRERQEKGIENLTAVLVMGMEGEEADGAEDKG